LRGCLRAKAGRVTPSVWSRMRFTPWNVHLLAGWRDHVHLSLLDEVMDHVYRREFFFWE
jgi:hypothetical protein